MLLSIQENNEMGKLYISYEAIEEMGKDYFENKSYEDYVDLAKFDIVHLDDGLWLQQDDYGDLYISYNDYDDFQFYDVEELSNLKNADTVVKDFK